MHVLVNILKVSYGLVIITVCFIGLKVICSKTEKERKIDERTQRAWLYYDNYRINPDD